MGDHQLYASKTTWVFVFALLYWAFCLFWGVRSAKRAKTASDFFVAGRQLPVWVFVMALSTSSFAGWIFVGQPALVLRDGFPMGYAAFCAIVLPLVGALFLKRQWMLGKRFGFVTPGEMFAAYFQDDVVRLFTVIVALLFAVPFLGLLLGAAGSLVSIVTDGTVSRDTAMWALTVVLLIYVTLGGVRAVAYVSTLQALLITAGTIILGLAALNLVGGFEAMNVALAKIAETSIGPWSSTGGHGGGDYNALFATAGVVQWTDGLGRETPVGGPWTALMVMTFVLAFAGIQASPAFSMWAFSSKDPKAFAPQQVWASACVVGLLLFVFATLQGLAGLLLGADRGIAEAGLAVARALPDLGDDRQGSLTATLIALIGRSAPWLVGVLTVCALAAVTAGCGAYMATAGAVIARDLYKRFFDPAADDLLQKRFARVAVLIVTALALLMATFARDAMIVLGGLALSLAMQMVPALLAVTWLAWLTRRGVCAGLVVGTVVVVLTDSFGQAITGGSLPWGQWPWTIHAAIWGLAANLVVGIVASAMTQAPAETRHRNAFHAFLGEHARRPTRKRWLVPTAWVLTLVWLFFSIGPGIVLGNHLFGAPNAGYAEWDFAMPSIWAWQLMWWGLGVLLVWFLAYKMELSTLPSKEVVAITDDVALTLGGASGRQA